MSDKNSDKNYSVDVLYSCVRHLLGGGICPDEQKEYPLNYPKDNFLNALGLVGDQKGPVLNALMKLKKSMVMTPAGYYAVCPNSNGLVFTK